MYYIRKQARSSDVLLTRLGASTIPNSACVLDMIGLSNHALSVSAKSPLLAVFEALPISIFGFEGLRVSVRCRVRGDESSLLTGAKVMTTTFKSMSIRPRRYSRVRVQLRVQLKSVTCHGSKG